MFFLRLPLLSHPVTKSSTVTLYNMNSKPFGRRPEHDIETELKSAPRPENNTTKSDDDSVLGIGVHVFLFVETFENRARIDALHRIQKSSGVRNAC